MVENAEDREWKLEKEVKAWREKRPSFPSPSLQSLYSP